uniref:Decaheme cytochrome c n=2 Tax=Streptomyces TaxID=1883 RepID=F6K7F9_9ACTN|nr:decaheme cytochrome c [Streptomyces pyridomyceticus]
MGLPPLLGLALVVMTLIVNAPVSPARTQAYKAVAPVADTYFRQSWMLLAPYSVDYNGEVFYQVEYENATGTHTTEPASLSRKMAGTAREIRLAPNRMGAVGLYLGVELGSLHEKQAAVDDARKKALSDFSGPQNELAALSEAAKTDTATVLSPLVDELHLDGRVTRLRAYYTYTPVKRFDDRHSPEDPTSEVFTDLGWFDYRPGAQPWTD